jgi:RHS repeat-associated protein
LYNKGSERQEELDLNVYQTHYRFLDPAIGRWWQVDPKASSTYDMSVYSSMNNNPVRFNDPLGDVVDIEHRRGFLGLGKKETLTYNNGALTKADGSAYTGRVGGFLKKAVGALNGIAAGSATGAKLLGEAQSSANTFKIVKTSGGNEFKESNTMAANAKAINATSPTAGAPSGGSGGTVYWNPSKGNTMEVGGGYPVRSDTNLAHELLGHGIDANRGEMDNTVVNGLKRDEWQATYVENTIRGEMGRPLREYYRVQDNGGVFTGLPPMMVTSGAPVAPPTMADGNTYIRP